MPVGERRSGNGGRRRSGERERRSETLINVFEGFLRAKAYSHFEKFTQKKTSEGGQLGWMDQIVGFLKS